MLMKTLSCFRSFEKDVSQDHIGEMTIRFQKTFALHRALKIAHANKEQGIPVLRVFSYLFALAFRNLSLYRAVQFDESEGGFGKDVCHRFLKSPTTDWQLFLNVLSSRIMRWLSALTSDGRKETFIIDDTSYKRNRARRVELIARQYDHCLHEYYLGFRCLCLAWSDGNTTIPVDYALLSSEKQRGALEASRLDRRSRKFRVRSEAVMKATTVVLRLLKRAVKAGFKTQYVMFDSWFTCPSLLSELAKLGLKTIGMVKQGEKMLYSFNGQLAPIKTIYAQNCKRRGRSKYLLSVETTLCKKGTKNEESLSIPVKLVFVRNTEAKARKAKNYFVLLSTDTTLSEEEIIQLYQRRWSIEVFFQVCKTYLRFAKESHGVSYDSMRAYIAVEFARYLMLAWLQRMNTDDRTMGEIFYRYAEELKEPDWLTALKELLRVIFESASENIETFAANVTKQVERFLAQLPSQVMKRLQELGCPQTLSAV